MKNVALILLASLLSLGMMASCESTSNTSSDNTDVSSTMENTESSESSKIQEDISSETQDENNATGGTADACTLHAWNYHSIIGELINYVGSEAFENWLDTVSGEEMNIVRFVNDFQIDSATFDEIVCYDVSEENLDGMTLDEYYTKWGAYNQEMREAIFANDDYGISKAFVSEYAVVASDGQIYSLEWLAEHDAEDYVSYGLPTNEIEAVVDRALERNASSYTEMAEQIEPQLTQAYALEEAALSSAETAVPEESNETAETGTESSAVVQDEPVEGDAAE